MGGAPGAMHDWAWIAGAELIERVVRRQVPDRKSYRNIGYVLALDHTARIGVRRFHTDAANPFRAARRKLPSVVSLASPLRAADTIPGDTETAADLRFLLGAGSPLVTPVVEQLRAAGTVRNSE